MFTIFAGLLLLDEKYLSNESGLKKIDLNDDLFKNIIFMVVLLGNAYFLILWTITFAKVLTRIHFKTIKRVLLKRCKFSISREIDDYDSNLGKYLD